MANAKSFGRRAVAQPAAPSAKTFLEFAPQRAEATGVAAQSAPPPNEQPPTSPTTEPTVGVDDELREWKQTRKARIPWRQLSLMASLSFGIASFVLTGTVAEAVDWLLYALSAASLYFWWSGRGKRT